MKRQIKKICFLCLLLFAGLMTSAFAAETVVDISNVTEGIYPNYEVTGDGSGTFHTLTITGDGVVLTGTTNGLRAIIEPGKILTLRNATISNTASTCAIEAGGTGCVLILEGTNSATGDFAAGVWVPETASLTIKGTGSLTAKAGDGGSYATGAGIGGGPNGNCGDVTILGGTVVAYGGNANNSGGGAGIGGGAGNAGATATPGNGGSVQISGGIVVATGGSGFGSAKAQDIGGGCNFSGNLGTAGTTIITGGSVKATTVDNPKNANTPPDTLASTSKTYTGYAGQRVSFTVNTTPSYQYAFDVPSGGTAYLWLPAARASDAPGNESALPGSIAGANATLNGNGTVTFSTTTTGTPDSFKWERSINPDMSSPTSVWTSAAGTTTATLPHPAAAVYYYRLMLTKSGVNVFSPVLGIPTPSVTGLTATLAMLPSSGGNSTITVSGTNLVTGMTVKAFDGATPTSVTGVTTGSGTSGTVTLNGFPANTSTAADKVYTIKISLNGGANYLDSPTTTVTVGKASPGGDPSDPTDPAQNLSSLLSTLNTALSPKASVTGLSSIPATLGTPITKAIPGNASFAKKDAPATAFPGYTALAPSFSSSVTLGANTTGNTLALKYMVNMNTLPGFENWGTLTDAQRAALLDSLKVIFAYEYADKTWKTLVGAGGIVSWADALKAGIVSFSATGLSLNYAVTDAKGDPAANGSVLVIPDGAKDNKIVDPVWLMTGSTVPASVTLNKTTLTLRPGATFQLTATVSPDTATNKKVAWKSSNPNFVSVDQTGKVTAVAVGTAIITVTTEDGNKTATCSVTVSDEALAIDLSGLGLVSGMLEIEPGETIDLRIETDPAGATFTATGLPQGLTLTSDGRLYGTVPQVGTYKVTVTATLNGESVSETFTIEVTEKGVKGSSSSGGCDAGLGGLAGVAFAALAAARRRREGA